MIHLILSIYSHAYIGIPQTKHIHYIRVFNYIKNYALYERRVYNKIILFCVAPKIVTHFCLIFVSVWNLPFYTNLLCVLLI